MGDIGIIIGLGLDPSGAEAGISQAEADLQGFGKSAKSVGENDLPAVGKGAQEAFGEVDRGLLNSHQSVHLLAEEMGIHLPSVVTSAVSEMLPQIANLGGALLAAFAAKEIYEFGKKIAAAAKEASGATEALLLMADAVKENNQAIEDYAKTSSRAAQRELKEINVRIATWTAALEARRQYFANENALTYGLQGFLGEVRKTTEGEKKLADMEKLRDELLKILTGDVVKEGKTTKEAEDEKREAWERSTDQQYEYVAARRKAAEEEFEGYVRLALEIDRMKERNAVLREEVDVHLEIANAEFWEAKNLAHQEELHKRLDTQVKMLTQHSRELRAEWDRLHPTAARMRTELQLLGVDTQQLSARQLEFIGVENQVVGALDKELMAYGFKAKAMKGFFAEELRELASFLTKKAHFKAMEQVAEALGAFPNFAAMGEHFAAAVAWEALGAGISGLAGSLAGRGGALGAGSQSGSGWSGGNRGGGGSDSPPQTLAGAAGGRFGSPGSGVVIIRGTQEFENYVAGAVNGAVARGVSVTATSSQRGAPVGH